jgi:hypothetical protein
MTADYPARPSLAPIVCAPWYTDGDGHPHEYFEDDQACWGCGSYVHPIHEPALLDPRGAWLTRLGVMAYRGINEQALVYVHLDLPGERDGIDVSVKLTADEARQLAGHLIEVADQIDRPR